MPMPILTPTMMMLMMIADNGRRESDRRDVFISQREMALKRAPFEGRCSLLRYYNMAAMWRINERRIANSSGRQLDIHILTVRMICDAERVQIVVVL